LLLPLGAIALLSLFLPGARLAIPSLLLALVGFATAVAGAHLEVTMVGSIPTGVWPGAGLSLFWLGLLGAAVSALEALRERVTLPALVLGAASVAAVVPLLLAPALGMSATAASNGRLLPAFTTAEAASDPELGTLALTAEPDGGIFATVHRGEGTTMDEQSTLASTSTRATEEEMRIATLAGNLASRSGFDTAAELQELQIAFVLVPELAVGADAETRQRVTDALDGNRLLTPVGSTANGFLWHFPDLEPGAAPSGPGPTETPMGIGVIVGTAIVFVLALLLAIPTGTRRRRVRATAGTEPATTFEDDSDE
jgi:hypothetical protein